MSMHSFSSTKHASSEQHGIRYVVTAEYIDNVANTVASDDAKHLERQTLFRDQQYKQVSKDTKVE